MKLYLVRKELNLLSKKVSYDTPVYISQKQLLTGFNKRTDGYLIPQVKKDTGEWYNSNLTALFNRLNTIAKLQKDYLNYELVFPKLEPFVPAKFIYDRINEVIVLEEDKYPFSDGQFDRFCQYYKIGEKERELLDYFITKKINRINERLEKTLEDVMKQKINIDNQYLIALLITKINKF
jgi:hypothetical protein